MPAGSRGLVELFENGNLLLLELVSGRQMGCQLPVIRVCQLMAQTADLRIGASDDTVVVCNLIFATPKQALILTMFWTALLSSARTIVQVCNIFDFNGVNAEVHGFRMSIRSRLVVDN